MSTEIALRIRSTDHHSSPADKRLRRNRADDLNLPNCPRCHSYVPVFVTACPDCGCGIYRKMHRRSALRLTPGRGRMRGL